MVMINIMKLIFSIFFFGSIYCDALTGSNNTNNSNNTNSSSNSNSSNTVNPPVFNTSDSSTDVKFRTIPSLIAGFRNISNACLNPLKPMISLMSDKEQLLLYDAFIAQGSLNNTLNDTGRCFSPSYFSQYFMYPVKIVNLNITNILTIASQDLKSSTQGISLAFQNLAPGNLNYVLEVTSILDAQNAVNQCLARFLLSWENILNARRRYLLTLNNIFLSIGQSDPTGQFIQSFPYTFQEVSGLTQAFLTFANCYSNLPNTLTNAVADSLA